MLEDDVNGLPAGQPPVDDARPEPGAPQPPAAPAAPPAATPEPASLDPDDLELAAARAALAEQQQGSPVAPAPATEGAPQQQPDPQPGAPAPAAAPGPDWIPRARLNEVITKARDRIQYLEGAVAALREAPRAAPAPGTTAPPAAPPAPPPVMPEERIAQLREQQRQAAKRFDDAEISFAEAEAIRQQHEDEIARIRFAQFTPPPPPAPAPSLADQRILDEQLQRLNTAHPYAQGLDRDQALRLAAFADEERVAQTGRPFDRSNPAEVMRLREEVAKLSDFYGPRWGIQPAQAAAPPSSTPPPAAGAVPLSPAAQARLDKMNLAAGLPPDPASFGHTGQQDPITPEAIQMMDDDAIGALPATTLARIFAGRY